MSGALAFTPRLADATDRPEALAGDATLDPQTACFEGHFPQDPVLPAMRLLLDLVARPASARWPDLVAPRGLSRVKFRRLLRPGDALAITLERRADAVSFRVRCAGEEAASGQVLFRSAAAR